MEIFTSYKSPGNLLIQDNTSGNLQIRSNYIDCDCPKIDDHTDYLILGTLSKKSHQEMKENSDLPDQYSKIKRTKVEIQAGKNTIAIPWRKSYRRKLRRIVRKTQYSHRC